MSGNLFQCEQTPVIDSFQGEYRFLSNFWPCVVEYEGVEYPSVENAYQAAKTYDEYRPQYKTITPGQAKRLSRKLPMIGAWTDEVKIHVMWCLLYQKFTQENELGRRLRETGDAILIEGNTWGDVFWGRCDGVGKNILGLMLTNRRKTLNFQYNLGTRQRNPT